MYRTVFAAVVLVLATVELRAETIDVWPRDSAEIAGVDEKQIPTLDLLHVKSDEPAPAVLVIPGGGYKHLSTSAWKQAKHCQSRGIAAFVLRYRLPVHGHRHPAPLHDAQRAMRLIRSNAEAWGIDPARIGVIGGSSGGHLASLLSNVNDPGDPDSDDPVAREGCRPAFTILQSPVITFLKPHAHWPSRARMLGSEATDEQAAALSPEKLVSERTPPVVLMHGDADKLVVPQNSELYVAACKAHGVPARLITIAGMAHGAQNAEIAAKVDAAFDRALDELVLKP
jgi:acetyl esterase/lipase